MRAIELSRTIAAAPATVFSTVADPEVFGQAVPGVQKVEVLGATKRGRGTRFRTARRSQDKVVVMEFEIVDFEPGKRVRIANDTHGTRWETEFTVTPRGNGTELGMRMTASPRRLLQRLMLALLRSLIGRGVERDLDAVQRFCEARR